MAPLSTSQVIASGAYLDDGFNPASLTIPTLSGVLAHHGVHFPSNAKKTVLVALFVEHITPNLDELREQRDKALSSQASDRGITDGITGEQVGEPDPVTPTPRRSTRRSTSRTTSAEPSSRPTRSRISSAESSTSTRAPRGASSRLPQAPLIEQDENESSEDEAPVKPVRVAKRAEPKARRVSTKYGDEIADVSGWEERNVFQSGPEDSPPPKRLSSRKSNVLSSPRPSAVALPAPSRLQTRLPEPEYPYVPPSASRISNVTPKSRLSTVASPSPIISSTPIRPTRSSILPTPPSQPQYFQPQYDEEEPDEEGWVVPEQERSPSILISDDEAEEQVKDDDHNLAISQRLAGEMMPRHRSDYPTSSALVQNPPAGPSASRSVTTMAPRVILALLFLLLSRYLYDYKAQSASIGYCDSGSSSNSQLRGLRAERAYVKECNRKLLQGVEPDEPHTRLVDGALCEMESIVPLPAPDSCTPCPPRANCYGREIECKAPFILQPHSLTQSPQVHSVLSSVFDGLPGFGSVAFPSQCVENKEHLKRVSNVGRGLVNYLAKIKAEKVCTGGHISDPNDGGDAKAWGLTVHMLAETTKASQRRIPQADYPAVFREAISELEKHGLVITEKDASGALYIASFLMDMDWQCRAKVHLRNAWSAWRRYMYALATTIVGIAYARFRVQAHQIESRRVAELVSLTLDTLRSRELDHHIDPVTAPTAFLSPMHLRDLILQDEHSPSARQRLWEKVERVVEGNANVRANVEDVHGDETRVWRWVGGAAGVGPPPRINGGRKRVSWGVRSNEVDGNDEAEDVKPEE